MIRNRYRKRPSKSKSKRYKSRRGGLTKGFWDKPERERKRIQENWRRRSVGRIDIIPKRGKGIFTIPALIAGALAVGKAAHLGSKLVDKLKLKDILGRIKQAGRIGTRL